MTIYHPGKVLAVYGPSSKDIIGSDKSTQALIEMWDENIFTCDVDRVIAPKLNEGDVVLIDYNPMSAKLLVPKQLVTKILRGSTAKKTWEKYVDLHKKRKLKETSLQRMPPDVPSQLYR